MGKEKYGSLVNANWSMDDYNSIIITSSDQDMGQVHQLLWDIHTLLHSVSSKYGVGPRIVKILICIYGIYQNRILENLHLL